MVIQRFSNPLIYVGLFLIGVMMATQALNAQENQKPNISTLENHIQQRSQLNQTTWQQEVRAQQFEQRFVDLWDRIRSSKKKLQIIQRFPLKSFSYPKLDSHEQLDNQVVRFHSSRDQAQLVVLDVIGFRKMVNDFMQSGFELVQSEWHHQSFRSGANPSDCFSQISFDLNISNLNESAHYIVHGLLDVTWDSNIPSGQLPKCKHIHVSKLEILKKPSQNGFHKILELDSKNLDQGRRMHPLIVRDLNRDGFSEIILAGINTVLWNKKDGSFDRKPFLKESPGEIGESGVVADFDGDELDDFLCVTEKDRRPVLFRGLGNGNFAEDRIVIDGVRIDNPSVLTTGDIDHDGDLDVWLAQYKGAYHRGQMPTPYFDANDGYPSFLLINNGSGVFSEETEMRGLGKKRFRRTYSSSFVDLDQDGDLDLIVVSDFSGVDLYQNNGKGEFSDVRDLWIDEWHNFGMAHCINDFNSDGILDFYVIGMSSTTMRRLDSMNLVRDGFAQHASMRSVMGYGNRMYIKRSNETLFDEPDFRLSVARTGWSWGTSAFDFDNDSDVDIYVSNGHISGKSSADYCSTFWCHDIYTGTSIENPTIEKLLNLSQNHLMTAEISWNGFEKNKLLMNNNGKSFNNVSFLFNTAMPEDCRGVVSDDLNRDGLLDLIVVEEWWKGQRIKGQTLHVLANTQINTNNWIGFYFSETIKSSHLIGAQIELYTKDKVQTRVIVTGDSFCSQHANSIHFGLGTNDIVKKAVIKWIGKPSLVITTPSINEYHVVDSL